MICASCSSPCRAPGLGIAALPRASPSRSPTRHRVCAVSTPRPSNASSLLRQIDSSGSSWDLSGASLPLLRPASIPMLGHASTAPQSPPPCAPWFEEAIRDVARHVSESVPFLEVVQLPRPGSSLRLSSFSVPAALARSGQHWAAAAASLAGHSPDLVMLVQRVDPGAPRAESLTGAGAPSGISSPPNPGARVRSRAEEACRTLLASGAGQEVLRGEVEDCCGGADAWTAAPDTPEDGPVERLDGLVNELAARERRAAGEAFAALSALYEDAEDVSSGSRPPAPATAGGGGVEVRHWGVVVQARHSSQLAGCYLLKTVRSSLRALGCTCTHFSLTRICQGQALEEQFMNAWLA